MNTDSDTPYRTQPGDVVVALPHTLTAATRSMLDARARAVLPSTSSFWRGADPRLVLDARDCAVVDDAGLAALWALRQAASAAGVGCVVVDAPPALAAWLTAGRRPPMLLAYRADDDPMPNDGGADAVPNDPPEPGVLRLDDAARERLARKRRR